ncbi:MAG TPA: hypothetical protein VFS64_03350 [Solirubrobacterales bacterium]|nr:hypothetical protein [Solirubrobacterales bacterium]
MSGPSLLDSLEGSRRIGVLGLAKNTGKTVAVGTLIRELGERGRRIGITSIGRDGEEVDAINSEIRKPRIYCPAKTLVATTEPLLRRSQIPHRTLVATGIRTPLGKVAIADLQAGGELEIAGPSSQAGLRAVSDEMLARGAATVVVDGSIDRRAAASPLVADTVVFATGAVLGPAIEDVAEATGRAFGWATVSLTDDRRIRELGTAAPRRTLLVRGDEVRELPATFALTVEPGEIRSLLRGSDGEDPVLLVGGVLPERLLEALAFQRRGNPVRVVAADPTMVFTKAKTIGWYQRKGVAIEVLRRARLGAVTVNPTLPPSLRLNSELLRNAIRERLRDQVPIVDVLHPGYLRQAA